MDDHDPPRAEMPDFGQRREREAAQHAALVKLRQECFHGAVAVGAVAGMLQSWQDHVGFLSMLSTGVGGVVVVLMAGFSGGFTASLLRSFLAHRFGLSSLDEEGNGEGPVLGGFGGAFLGLLLSLLLWDLEAARLYMGVGTAIGSFLGGMPGEHVAVFIRMLALHEHEDAEKNGRDEDV